MIADFGLLLVDDDETGCFRQNSLVSKREVSTLVSTVLLGFHVCGFQQGFHGINRYQTATHKVTISHQVTERPEQQR